jgi:hypothetical protein
MNDFSQADFGKLATEVQTATLYGVAIKDLVTFAATFNEQVVRPLNDAGKHAPPPFEAIRASYGDDGAALMLAIQLTIGEELQIELANALALAPGSLERAGRLGLSSGAARSIAEGVFRDGASLEDVLHLMRIVRVARAVCLVKKGVESIGTGFLVARNLILTAAHVLLDHGLMDKHGPLAGIEDLHFVFHNELESLSGTWPYRVRPAKHWRVAWSPACISDPDGHELSLRSAECLDYALIRIADAMPEHIFHWRSFVSSGSDTYPCCHLACDRADGRDWSALRDTRRENGGAVENNLSICKVSRCIALQVVESRCRLSE